MDGWMAGWSSPALSGRHSVFTPAIVSIDQDIVILEKRGVNITREALTT